MTEDELRDLLHGAAARGGTALLDHDAAADAVVERHGVRRRHRTALIAAAACAALIAVVVPSVWPSARTVPDRDVAQSLAAVLDWPVRGSLADDAAAVEEVRRLDWSEPLWTPALDARRVVFLGDVEGTRRALVVGSTEVSGAVTGQWFAGPVGADPATLVPEGVVERLEDAASAAHVSAGENVLLVLVGPGDGVELSPRVEVGADGSVRRDFAPLVVDGGVAVTAVGPQAMAGPGVYRVLRDGTMVESRFVPASTEAPLFSDAPELTPLDPDAATPVPRAVDMALEDVVSQTGWTVDQVRLDLLFSGPVPGVGTGAPVDGVVLAVTLPNGAVVVSTGWSAISPNGGGASGSCGAQAHPAGTPIGELAVATLCWFPSDGTDVSAVLVHYATPAFDRVGIDVYDGEDDDARSRGFGTITTPLGAVGTLRATGPAVDPLEVAVVDGMPDGIVDRSGRGWED